MSWGKIELRYRDSKNVFFEGEASPAPGGGSRPVYVQSADPGAAGTGVIWFDTTFDPPLAQIRNAADSGWDPYPAELLKIPDGSDQYVLAAMTGTDWNTDAKSYFYIDREDASNRWFFGAENEDGSQALSLSDVISVGTTIAGASYMTLPAAPADGSDPDPGLPTGAGQEGTSYVYFDPRDASGTKGWSFVGTTVGGSVVRGVLPGA